MPVRLPARATLVAGLLLVPAAALAQTADTLRLTADLGVVNTAGNTELTTLNVGQGLRWRRGRLALGQTFRVVYGRSDGVTTSAQWRAGVRGDYAVSGAVAIYAATGYDRDRFAGIARRIEEGAGIAVGVIRRVRDRLDGEAGLSLVQQRSTLATENDFASARAAASYTHHFAEATFLRQTVGLDANLQDGSDYRVSSESALVAPLSRRLALQISYVARFDHKPEPGFRSTDRLLTSGLQISF